jgi:tripartite-type tricarboxylate transporter receptor subunit TctC
MSRPILAWLLLRSATAVLVATLCAPAHAEPYPTRPVHLIVGTSGGAQDLVARLIAQSLRERMGKAFVVDVRSGAGSMIAADAVARSPADGYTLLLMGAPNAIRAAFDKPASIPDILPVASILRTPEVLVVNASLPVRTFQDLIAYARANPGRLNFASPGKGTGPHMSAELLKMMAGIDITHVPYRGAGPAISDLLGGQVQMMFVAPVVAMPHVKAGTLRALAVTSRERSPLLPDVPSVREFLEGYESGGFFGIGVPRGTPGEVAERLNREVNATLEDPAIVAQIVQMGATTLPGSPEDFSRLVAMETAKWAKVIRHAGIRLESEQGP